MIKKWAPIKEMLFTYLAVSKILYWLDTASYMNQHDLGNVWQAVLLRFVNRDFMIIVSVVAFYFLDKYVVFKKSKSSKILEHIVYYIIGYVAIAAVTFIYIRILMLFAPVTVDSWVEFIGYGTLGYLVVIVVLELKQYFKGKQKPKHTPPPDSPPPDNANDKSSMLKLLHDDGTLTKEEYENAMSRL